MVRERSCVQSTPAAPPLPLKSLEISAGCLQCPTPQRAERCSNPQVEWHAFDTRCSGDVSPGMNRGPLGPRLRRPTAGTALSDTRTPKHARSTLRVRFLRTLNWKRPEPWRAQAAALYAECVPHVANTNATTLRGASGEGQSWMATVVPLSAHIVERQAEFLTSENVGRAAIRSAL